MKYSGGQKGGSLEPPQTPPAYGPVHVMTADSENIIIDSRVTFIPNACSRIVCKLHIESICLDVMSQFVHFKYFTPQASSTMGPTLPQ